MTIIDYSEELKIKHEEELVRQKEIENQRKINEEKLRIQTSEKEKLKLLEENSNRYERACRIREYIQKYSLKSNLSESDLEYIQWAKDKADWIDPLIKKEDKILDEKIPDVPKF